MRYELHYGLASGIYNFTPIIVKQPPAGDVVTSTVYLPDRNTYYFAVKACSQNNESGFSNEVVYTPPPETVSQPLPPRGPLLLQAGVSYLFAAQGLVSNWGDAVQYRFFWSDGTDSGWLPVGNVEASKTWSSAGTYADVRVQARCATHTAVESPLSAPVSITVETAPLETITQPASPVGATAISDLRTYTYAAGGSASDAGHPLEYRLLWGDGTASTWLNPDQVVAGRTWSLPGTYDVRTEARCHLHPAILSSPSGPLAVRVHPAPGEVVAAPPPPTGPGDGLTGLVYGYTGEAASSSNGDPLQYRFQWGDGTASLWFSPGRMGTIKAWKAWPVEGVYSVRAEARCALHPSGPATSDATAVSIVGGDSLLLADSFADGTDEGDSQWQTLSGRWLVGRDKTFTSGSLKSVNLATVKALPEFREGRVSTRIRLTRGALQKNTGIVFSLSDAQAFRYIFIRGSRISIGQVGDTPGERAGIKKSAVRSFQADRWYQLRVDLSPDGRVSVFLNKAKKPVLTYRFADTVAGRFGVLAQKSVAYFDDFRAWDARVLP